MWMLWVDEFFRRISATLLLFFILNKLESYTLGWALSEIWEEFYCDNTSHFLIDLVSNKWICGWWNQIFCNNLILEACCILREHWLTLFICFVLFISLRRKNVLVADKAMFELKVGLSLPLYTLNIRQSGSKARFGA